MVIQIFKLIFVIQFIIGSGNCKHGYEEKLTYKKTGLECFGAFVKEVRYFYEILEQRSTNLVNITEDNKIAFKQKMKQLDHTLARMARLQKSCTKSKFTDKHCLKDCMKLSNDFAKNTMNIYRVMGQLYLWN